MTNQEAIQCIKTYMAYPNGRLPEAGEKAIEALGTIDQIAWERDIAVHQLKLIGKELGQSMDDVVSEREKQTPKYTIFNDDMYHVCPTCWYSGKFESIYDCLIGSGIKYCYRCGQRINLYEVKRLE